MIQHSSMERQYLAALHLLTSIGADHEDRTGVGTNRIFGYQMRCNLQEGFPLLTTKYVHFRSVITELRWFLLGRTDVQFLKDRGCTIWDEWATKDACAKYGREEGDLGPVYGKQWRNFGDNAGEETRYGFDQLKWLVEEIVKNPNSRRLILTAWDPLDASNVALPPCHTLFQCQVQDGKLSLHLYMRSCDVFLGLPFNIASYALLVHLLAYATNLAVGDLIISFGDLHLYKDHREQARTQLDRVAYNPPQLVVMQSLTNTREEGYKPLRGIEFLESAWDVQLDGYTHHPAIKAQVAV